MTTARSGRTTSRKKKPGKNGRHGIDMTPPDKLLKQAVKRIGKFRENEKVLIILIKFLPKKCFINIYCIFRMYCVHLLWRFCHFRLRF